MNQSPDQQKLLAQAVDAYEFRGADTGDIGAIVNLYDEFFHESDWPNRNLTFDPKRMWAWAFKGIVSGEIPHLIAIERSKNELVGSICYTMDHNFTTKPFAHLDKFFVRKRWRRSAVPRVLLTLILEIARADGAACFNANALSGMKEVASLKNLLLHMGFRETNGIAMTRNFDDV